MKPSIWWNKPKPGETTVTGVQYDHINQAWLQDGRYSDCAHPQGIECQCYGKIHKGELKQ